MNYQNIHVNGNRMEPNRIYAGTRGSYITDVSFSFSGEWEGLTKKLIFYPVRGTPVYTVYTYGTVRIPARVMRNAGISVMLISGYRVTEDGKIGEKIITASASVLVESAESDVRNEPDIPEATVFEEIVAKLGAPYIGESGNWYIWDVDTHEFVDTGLPARGEKGETGRGLTILGKYSSLDELRESVKDAQPGDAYAVGEKAPYTIYIWDEVTGDFTNHGDMRGVGITKIEQITDNTGSGEPNTILIVTDDGAEYDYTVYNGERGHPGNIWIGETEPPDDSYTIWLNPGGAVSGFLESHQGTENAGKAMVVGEDGTVVPGEAKGNVELDTTLTQSGKAADAKAVGDALAALSGTNAELPFTENEISGVASGGGFVVNPTNFADGKTYFRYHAGASFGFKWKNPNPQKGSLTITVRGYSQYSNTLNTRIVTVYTDGSDNGVTDAMYLRHGETITYTTDPNKTVDYIRGNYDFENWVLLDMDVLSIVADYLSTTGTVKSVNGILPDENGNVEIPVSGGTLVEPAEDDIPKVFFGGALQQTKDEAVVPFRYISKTQDISGYAEIKAQGNSSMSYPKKNQTVKLYKDEDCDEKLKIDFKGWGKQSKFCFKANWIDLTHARNVVSARLWGDVVKSRANYEELPELLRTSPNQGAVNGFPIKVYANGVYQGRYTANIPKDAWMANMDDELDNHCILCGENYVSGCFRAAANINGSDWTDEVHDTVPASIKTRWNEVISFVMNSTDEEFKANLGSYFYVDSLIDYYLFGLVSCGLDAFGKNQLYMTYNGQKWIATMYDMDSTWGLWWNGSSFVATDYDRSEYQDFKDGAGNLLFIRLEELFCESIKVRWEDLKHGALSIENIINRFERFTDIAPAELVKEDYASTTGGGKFTGIPSQSTNNIQQLRAYANARLAWTNEYVAALTGGEVDPDEPDEPVVPDEPVTGSLLYSLPEATTFNGTSDYIDTGVKLFDTNKDFTILLDFEDVYTASASNKYVLHCVHEATPYPGVSVWISNDEYRMTGAGKLGFKSISDGRFRVAVTKDAASGVITAKCIYGTDTATSANVTSAILDETVLLGVKKNADGSLDSASYWGGTIYQCDIYDYKFTDAEISAHIGIESPSTYEEEILYENYSPNGVAFIEDVDIDFAAGDYIEASIDASAVTSTSTVFSVGQNIAKWNDTDKFNYHVSVEAGGSVQFNVTASGTNADRQTLNASSPFVVKVDRNGIWCNDQLLIMDEIANVADNYGIAKAKMLELSTVQVGAAEGNTKSVATYNYIKVCRAKDVSQQ